MRFRSSITALAAFALITPVFAGQLSKGAEVFLTFRDPVNSKMAQAGDVIHFVVTKNVRDASGHIVIAQGTPVSGVIDKVDQNDHFGKNARIRIDINPVNGIHLQPRDKGKMFGGTRTDEAAAASGGAALVLGPLGLVGGYFVVGHSVHIHPGQELRTVVGD
jgi:hypothetical protein